MACLRYKKVDTKKAWTTIVTGIARNGTTMNTTYSKGAKTVTSTGFSFDKGASFSVNGARERAANVNAVYLPQTAKRKGIVSRAYEARIAHDVLRRECLGNNEFDYRVQYLTSPAGLSGGFRNIEDTSRAPVACKHTNTEPASGLDTISTENAKAYTYERAFGFVPAGLGGFTGNALSGYSEQVQVTFNFGGADGSWCGHSAGPLAPGQIVQGFDK